MSATLEGRAPRPTVLVVDDDVNVRALLVRLLDRAGYNVLEARSGRDAIAIAAGFDGTIDVLLSDVVMTDVPGWRVGATLRAQRSECAIVYMSGYELDTESTQSFRVSGSQFLGKPFTPAQLLYAIGQAQMRALPGAA